MKHQEVRVNIWQMIVTSGSYLFLAMCAWVLLRLVNACFWLPGALKKQQAEEEAKMMEEFKLQQAKEEGGASEQMDHLPEDEEEVAEKDVNQDKQPDKMGEDTNDVQESKKTI